MKIAIVGTGFVADYYMTTLPNHPSLTLSGVYDRDPERLKRFCAFYDVRAYADIDAILADPEIAIVVNLTTPESHYEISKRALEVGKHVYCEKPLAMRFEEAQELVELASRRRLILSTAPANALSDANRLVRKALAERSIGTPRLVYAQMEDGAVFRGKWKTWRSRSGARWPGLHEFEIGCTLEHAGYGLSWLVSLFGPATSLTAFSAVTFPDKGPGTEEIAMAPDFSVGCIQFRSGVIARLTCGLAAPRDRSFTILGDGGSITVRDLWDNRSAVHLERLAEGKQLKMRMADWLEGKVKRALPWKPTPGRRLSYKGFQAEGALPAFPSRIDFAAGIAAQARSVGSGIPAFFSGDVALHVTELALALNNAHDLPQPYVLRSSFTQPARLP
ncbi:gfo/Idh/MocA family oxidoreductase [Phyllobacterium phragmitis]|uniref:Gfo/Idh/MocA family oxidoreductase n=1 Tax=Phyllobacterium phragmitis TaxID=2670329 RepID=A0A2S9IJX3_9HYPH|nr:Gfo/Idh/MocA family oxidoreductase [Phyllobacterium phragmitis]PRD40826.1 gfo/Idh/MocA family oxidoreductase [Phyllobacterium phragmitis]